MYNNELLRRQIPYSLIKSLPLRHIEDVLVYFFKLYIIFKHFLRYLLFKEI